MMRLLLVAHCCAVAEPIADKSAKGFVRDAGN